jgi:response regulator RpfG family c-di-GMP phosphodiesterase
LQISFRIYVKWPKPPPTSLKESEMPAGDQRPRILCVDDEKNVLEGLSRTLRGLYCVETAVGGAQGLDVLKSKGPFAIVVSDLRMPAMTGVEFLARSRLTAPDTVRVLLTGHGDLEAAISAVNDGNIFRFLTKPCPADVLAKSLAACAEQHRLITSERVLLEQTLRGSIQALTDILALADPAAFGRAARVRQHVVNLMSHFGVLETWPVEVAAMLSQIPYVTLPPATQQKVYDGAPLSDPERLMLERMPKVLEQILANIPRLENVREILRLHFRKYQECSISADVTSWGARALKVALDYDRLESSPGAESHPFDVLRGRSGWYDPVILEALAGLQGSGCREVIVLNLPLRELTVGMFFDQDVKSSKGLLLIARGQEVTPGLLERVRNFSPGLGICEPIRMVARQLAHEPATMQQVLA